jgi:cytochrome P450 family 114
VIGMADDVLTRLQDDENVQDPHPFLAWMRENEPVARISSGAYLVSRHADVRVVFDHTRFRKPEPDEREELWPNAVRYETLRMLAEVVSMRNPPEHTRLRRLFAGQFGKAGIDQDRATVTRICEELLAAIEDPLHDGETVNLHAAVSMEMPGRCIAELVGIPEDARPWLFALVPTLLAGVAAGASDETLVEADRATARVTEYMLGLIEQRRAQPGPGILSEWIRAHDDDGVLTDDEMLGMMWAIVMGGWRTLTAGLSTGMLAALQHPELVGWLEDSDEAALRAFAQEALRHESPALVGGTPYFSVRDIEFSGGAIPAGSEVRTVLAAANRDPEAFPDPDRFDPARDNSKSLSLGGGIHYCAGAHLVALQMTTLLRTLHQKFQRLVLADEPLWGRTFPLRSLESLPVALEP